MTTTSTHTAAPDATPPVELNGSRSAFAALHLPPREESQRSRAALAESHEAPLVDQHGTTLTAPSNPGVTIEELTGLGIANVLLRRGQREALAARWREEFHLELPRGPKLAAAGDLSILGTGPESWLAIQVNGGNAFAATLRSRLAGTASIIDQSDAYGVLRLTGPHVRATLEKLVPIDVHERTFPVGTVAGTVAAHVTALLWRLPDSAQGEPTFDIAVPRSLAASFWHALIASAAEFGVERK